MEECCSNKNGKYVQNTGIKIEKISVPEQESDDTDPEVENDINGNREETVIRHNVVKENEIEGNGNSGTSEKRKLNKGDESGATEGGKKQKSHNAEQAAMTAGMNAVKCQRNGKKGTTPYQSNKVRQACLKIPLVYSHRTQRLPPFPSTPSNHHASLNDVSVDKVQEKGDDAVKVLTSESSETLVLNHDNFNAAYYFPSTDSEKWLCVFKTNKN